MGPKSTLKEKLESFFEIAFCGFHQAEVEELPPPPPIPRRTNLNRQGTLRRVGTVKEDADGRPVRRSRPSTRRSAKQWDPDAPCGSKDVPANPHIYLKGPMTEEELDAAFRESMSHNPFGHKAQVSEPSSWDRPLSFYMPADQKLEWTASQMHLTLVPNDSVGGDVIKSVPDTPNFDDNYFKDRNPYRSRKGKEPAEPRAMGPAGWPFPDQSGVTLEPTDRLPAHRHSGGYHSRRKAYEFERDNAF